MLASALSFTVEASLVKTLGGHYPAVVILFWRQAVCVVLLAPLIARDWRGALGTTRPVMMAARSIVGVAGILLAVIAYTRLPLADANALSFTRVLWMTLFAALVLREALGAARVLATAVGFVGILIMLQPGGQGLALGWGHAAGLGAALLTAVTILSVKVMARDHSVLTLTVYAGLLGLVFSAPFATAAWVSPQSAHLPALMGVGVFGLLTLWCYTRGMQMGSASVMAPIDYSRLVFAALAGLLVFGEGLTATTIMGAAIIVGATLYLTLRRRVV